ncbi:CoA-substrate-specific enzyme activase, putative [Desulfocicer vacuolatum DSM 3385]|uniref:CoA-substrate-specific enzyme activase, putative n=1 Tax=Desulfocicer vacuolatum DSM 3385 TaxID=1121400 RepID=A0A1W1ZN42_9BACT|nr:acyl-CoA dehydratase activase [Desulfocicer vacuolatum]SMC49826.1 CoA-substrate-specific enzyme activase, putative [Desulfocicer vacuolatum DSM 3385]
MEYAFNILGIDIGSVSVSVVGIDNKGNIFLKKAVAHQGDVVQGLKTALGSMAVHPFSAIAATAATPDIIKRDAAYDEQVAIIRAAKKRHGAPGAILNVGGEKFSLSLFDPTGRYAGSRNNTSCAAGTGSFLDQQSTRLGLSGPEALSRAAFENTREIPDIATRCAVFAKTDLIHAQQEGFSVPQICDGLCRGLARNIANTLFTEKKIREPIIFCGGVSRNLSVKKHLEQIIEAPLISDENSHLFGALGAALCLADDIQQGIFTPLNSHGYNTMEDMLVKRSQQLQKHFFPQLNLTLSTYPDFSAHTHFVENGVENDIYMDPARMNTCHCFLGMDVGSTSTKAVIVTKEGEVMAGFYTRTASRPVQAVQAIFKSIDAFISTHELTMEIMGCGTTGSGRKLSSAIMGADLVLDEITAHSRAAFELTPEVDTIIEIGGQDAKFTTMKNGVVTSSFMNTVCAAGTGSFIEEQALKLGCPLEDYSRRAESVCSPISSDRCTVFMERDMNHFLSEGYSVDEVLASALHSVRDNYMSKVATQARIGDTVLFQGATAKNRALVAAFEQLLEKPIHVSPYCHLTGALGVALTLKDQPPQKSYFRGFNLWKQSLPVRRETCQLCTNHCKLTIVTIEKETVAFGFLCGRDYNTDHFVPPKNHFHLLRNRKKGVTLPHPTPETSAFTLGIPAALYLVEDLNFWKIFFNYLGIKTITSEKMKSPVTQGRAIATAEFCTPVAALHGHVSYLLEKADQVFLPYYFEQRIPDKKIRRQYCYYTQYMPSVIASLGDIDEKRLISPVVKYLHTAFHTKMELYRALKKIPNAHFSFFDVASAHEKALAWKKGSAQQLKAMMIRQQNRSTDIDVLLVGRPYTILSETLNAGILDIFASMKVNAFFQDMLDMEQHNFDAIEPLLREIHWKHAATILKATLVAARTDNLFPVYITSFKCSPDAFAVGYFKKIMEAHNKPYLVLELDEHDSSVGYETRIEAAVRAFRNHRQTMDSPPPVSLSHVNPKLDDNMSDKTIVMPNWDPITGKFLAAVLRGEGYNAILMEETTDTIKKSLKTNTGQCIPLNAIAAGYAQTIKNHDLDPGRTVLWMSKSDIACNIKLYPHHIKTILTDMGADFGKAGVYKGELSFSDISMKAALNAYFAYMFGGLIRSLGCTIRPYEIQKGKTDAAIARAVDILTKVFEDNQSKEKALAHALEPFKHINTHVEPGRPKVGIFGDFYVRDNDVMSHDLIHFIEAHGGEVVTTPYYRFAKMIASSYFRKWFKEGKYKSLISGKTLLTAMNLMESKYYRYFEPLFNAPDTAYDDPFDKILAQYGILPEHTGESMDNILKIHYTLKAHPDLALFVQTSPAFCCPGLVTEAMASSIEKHSGVPMVSITYDGLGGNPNRVIIPFLKYAGKNGSPEGQRVSM